MAGVCFASRTERPTPLASEATLGDEREANPGRYRPLTVLIGEKGEAAGFRMADGFAVCGIKKRCCVTAPRRREAAVGHEISVPQR